MERTKKPAKKDEEKMKKLFHDLRTPLAVMRINLDLIRLSEEYKTTPSKIKKLIKATGTQIDVLVEKISKGEKTK